MTPVVSAQPAQRARALAEPAPRRANLDTATVLDQLRVHAANTPDAAALRLFDAASRSPRVWTYAQLASSVGLRARILAQQLPPGSPVILRAPNSAELVSWFLAGLHAGLHVLLLHPHSTRHESLNAARRASARAIIAADRVDELTHIPLAAHDEARGGSLLDTDRSPGSILLHSTGSTSTPKLVRRTEASLDADGRNVARAARLTPDDRIAAVVPLSHSYGVDLLVATIISGACLDIFDRFDPSIMHPYLAGGGATVLPGVPSMFAALARDTAAPSPRGLRLAFSAGTHLPRRVAEEIHRLWALPLGQLYGATELGSVTLDTPDSPGFDPASVGLPMSDVSIRAVAPADPSRTLAPGQEGELAIRAPSMFAEYIAEPAPFTDGHFLTGDLGYITATGRVYITGRLKHLIDVGGLKINPVEVEEVFGQHPAIADCAVVPLELSDTIAKLRLLYIPREGSHVSASDLRAFARERLAPHKLPRAFDPVESLPRSPSGKLLRHLIPHA